MRAAVGLCLAGIFASIMLRGDSRTRFVRDKLVGPAPAMMLWAWEEPEDLRAIDPRRVGVAFLAERVFLGRTAQPYPRRQSILVPGDAYAVSVVRLEALPDFEDSPGLRAATAAAVLRVASLPGIRGVQVDFDATVSQREFYMDVLRSVHEQMPPGLGLTITALVSWCSTPDGWLTKLPVDAAVPMEFRLGKHAGRWEVREPLCRGNVGVSTDEPGTASALSDGARVYLFSPRPWTAEQLSVLNRVGFSEIARGGR